jgi:hypothetical protein
MKVTSAAKVGFTAILLALVLIGTFKGLGYKFSWFGGGNANAYKIYVNFVTVKGLNSGGDVQLNGNPVGEVGEITNDGYGGVVVELNIRTGQQIHRHAKFTIGRDSIFGGYLVTIDEALSGYLVGSENKEQAMVRVVKGSVQLGGLVIDQGERIGKISKIAPNDDRSDLVTIAMEREFEVDPTMAFVPSRAVGEQLAGLDIFEKLPDGASVDGIREPGPEDLVADVDRALLGVTKDVSSVLSQVNALIANFSGVLDKAKVQEMINTISSQAILIADNIARLSSRLDSLVAENQPHINATLQNVEQVSSDAHVLLADLQKYNSPEFRQKIEDITTNLKTATESLNLILTDLEGMTSDKETIQKIKDTINQANTTLVSAQETLDTTKKAVEKAQSKMSDLGNIDTRADFTLRVAPDPNTWSGDIDFKLGTKKGKTFLQGGVTGIGENDRVRAQIGQKLSDTTSGKLGIYKGKVSIGADFDIKDFSIGTDFYDPNEITWDIFGTWAFSPQLGIVIGVEDLLDNNQTNVGLKVRF